MFMATQKPTTEKKARIVKQDAKKWLKDLAQKLSSAELEHVQTTLKTSYENLPTNLSAFEQKLVDGVKSKL